MNTLLNLALFIGWAYVIGIILGLIASAVIAFMIIKDFKSMTAKRLEFEQRRTKHRIKL